MLGIEGLSTTNLVIMLITMFIIAGIFSILGRGGGEFYVPILISFLAIPYFDIATVSLFALFTQAAGMLLIYGSKHKLVDWPLAISLAVVVGIFAFTGGYLSFGIKASYLKGTFAVLLLISAYLMYKGKKVQGKPGSFGVWHRTMTTPEGKIEYEMNFLLIIVPTAVIAFIAGAVGISGCGMIIPVCIILGAVPIRIAIGSNSLLLLTSVGTGFLGHAVRGQTPWALAFVLAGATLCGGLIGSRMHVQINEKTIKYAFITILIVASFWMLYKIYAH
ncbi:MAG: sulfite exporter TauE/SafE family protein [Deltaproteobacteria bacterium]|nr:sulfite exporter TauE/SafE family protein [Deltaproteobacteria bacterium]